MPDFLHVKQSTAVTVPVYAADSLLAAVVGKVDGNWTKRISKNGGAFAAMTVTITEMENGWYGVPLSASHTDTLGPLCLTFLAAGVVPVNMRLWVSPRLIDDLAFPNTSGRGMAIDGSGGVSSPHGVSL